MAGIILNIPLDDTWRQQTTSSGISDEIFVLYPDILFKDKLFRKPHR